MILKLRWILLYFWIISVALASGLALAGENTGNIKILIDVSGSMKQNDPENKRVSAVRLLINLLPNGSQAGIWLFAENTELLIKTSKVSRRWKQKALTAVKKIHSRGIYTDIEGAISAVLGDGFRKPDNNNLILLTDGMVDISPDIMQSAESRERILTDLIPVLQQRQIKVHTIALSDNADTELLQQLSFDSNGWTETSQTAEHLQKTFLQMFNKALPQDGVPLKNNKFDIDKSIQEFSILVFKKNTAKKTRIIRPDKKIISSQSHGQGVSWVGDKHYDLITVQHPAVGEWTVLAETDPANQVMIMTDMKLHIDDLPEYISEQETVGIRIHFTEHGQLIKRQDFLKLVDVTLQQSDELGREKNWKLLPQADHPGYFSQQIHKTLTKGRHTLKILADGKTFKREIVRILEVIESVMRIKKSFDSELGKVTLELIPDQAVIDTDMITVKVDVKRSSERLESHEITPQAGRMLLELDRPEPGEKIIVNFSVFAKTVRGEPVTPKIKPVIIDDQWVAAVQSIPEAKHDNALKGVEDGTETDAAKPVKREEADNQIETDEEEQVDEEVEENGSWGIVIGGVVLINLILLALGFFAYRYLRKKAAAKQEQLLERLT